MTKTISIIRGNPRESYQAFHERIRQLTEILKVNGPAKLHYTITLERPPKVSVIPFRKDKIALISVTSEQDRFSEILRVADGYAGSFEVNEALPISYDKTWPDGDPTPGICLLTLFRKKKGLSYETFIDRWFNGHTPLTLKIHPIFHYNRNEVKAMSGDPVVSFDGIVEEHCMTRSELLNPFKFFAKSGFAFNNMIKTYFDVNGFIDYKSIETYLVQEIHIIS